MLKVLSQLKWTRSWKFEGKNWLSFREILSACINCIVVSFLCVISKGHWLLKAGNVVITKVKKLQVVKFKFCRSLQINHFFSLQFFLENASLEQSFFIASENEWKFERNFQRKRFLSRSNSNDMCCEQNRLKDEIANVDSVIVNRPTELERKKNCRSKFLNTLNICGFYWNSKYFPAFKRETLSRHDVKWRLIRNLWKRTQRKSN